MTVLIFTFIILLAAIVAGLLGSMTGLGGGVILIPVLTLGFHVDIRYAIGASLVASIATSSGAAAAYIKEGITNIRIGMLLEIATTTGAVTGAFLAMYIPGHIVAIIFGVVLIFSALMSIRRHEDVQVAQNSKLASVLKLNNTYPTSKGPVAYNVTNVAGGYSLMTLAGVISGILGIGSGALKVLAMDTLMKIPFKVSTTTSNFMIGVTAAASAVVYFQRGYIDPGIALPVIVGVLAGSFLGSKFMNKLATKQLRLLFSVVISLLAIEMIYNGITKNI